MKHVLPRSLGATAVIATVLALGSTPAFAQDASAPVADAPPVASAPAPVAQAPAVAAPAPQIVLPDVTTPQAAAPAAQAPAPEPVAAAPDAPAPQVAAVRSSHHVVTRAAESKAVARSVPVQKAEVTPAPKAATPLAAAPVTRAPADGVIPPAAKNVSDNEAFNSGSRVGNVAEPAQDSKPAPVVLPDNTGPIAGGLVVLLGLGGAAAFLASRRRKTGESVYEPAETVEPIVPAAAIAEPAPVAAAPAARTFAPASMGMAFANTQFASGPIPCGDARDALLQRMVEAEPDAANPFTSQKARRRRARLILQSREQRQAETTEQPFDFRAYRPSVRAGTADAAREVEPLLA